MLVQQRLVRLQVVRQMKSHLLLPVIVRKVKVPQVKKLTVVQRNRIVLLANCWQLPQVVRKAQQQTILPR